MPSFGLVSRLRSRGPVRRAAAAASVLLALVVAQEGCSSTRRASSEAEEAVREPLSSSSTPPGGLAVSTVPQFVAVTFDDNFNTEGMDWATSYFRPLVNGAGSGNPGTFDGAKVRTTFPCNSVYLGGMQASWQTAVTDGHEIANHTVNHGDGIAYSVDQWTQEIDNCTAALVSGLPQSPPVSITGFRSPYLHYDDNLFTVLVNGAFAYDTSIMNCWRDTEDGTNCDWPYTMESGSPDADEIFAKWSGRNVVAVGPHAGLWELPVAVVFVPDDSLASKYGFAPGLRQRVANHLAGEGNPNFFEQATGKLVGMDITLFLDGQMSRPEVLATLEHTLDLHLAGNRAPMVFVAHTHVYASNWDGNAPGTPVTTDRRGVIQDFVTYALSKPEVRMRPLSDVLEWMKHPVPLGACTKTTCAAQAKTCGSISDGCGGSLACGTCAAGLACTSENVCQACTRTTCAAQGRTCGSVSDGCGGSLVCGTCAAGQTCSASGTCQVVSTCTGTVANYAQGKCGATAAYNGNLYRCLSQAVNVNGETTGCGVTGVYCSSIAPDNGAWGTTAWQLVQSCGTTTCTPTTCGAQGRNCSTIADGCGGTLTCGTCAAGQACVSGVCQASCVPTTCAAQGKNCSAIADGCGGTLTCGTCAAGQTCTSNVCQTTTTGCAPTITAFGQGKCGATVVYGGVLYSCISQAAGVNGEPAGCGTAGVYCNNVQPDNAAWGSTAWQRVAGCN